MKPTANGSVYVKPQDIEWKPDASSPASSIKVLYKKTRRAR